MGHGAGKGCRIFRARWKGRIEGLLVSRLVLPSLQAPGTRVCKGGGGDREFEWNAHNAAPRRDRCGGNCADTTPTSGQLGLIALKL